MSEKNLLATLDRLQDEIARTDQLHDQTVQKLKDTVRDIQERLARSDKSPEEVEFLRGSLHEIIRQYEADHPAMMGWIRQIADGLAGMGI